jgi:hypothetical protein
MTDNLLDSLIKSSMITNYSYIEVSCQRPLDGSTIVQYIRNQLDSGFILKKKSEKSMNCGADCTEQRTFVLVFLLVTWSLVDLDCSDQVKSNAMGQDG